MHKLPPKILVIEFDESSANMLCNTIERNWYDVYKAKETDDLVQLSLDLKPNLIIISSKLKNISALNLATKIKQAIRSDSLPIIFLIDKTECKASYVSGSDSLTETINRPYTPNELIYLIKALMRKSQPIFQDKILKYKDVKLDLLTYKVYKGNHCIHLGPTEFSILQFLLENPKVIHSREMIIDYVWKTDKFIEPRTIDVHINRLRKLLDPAKTQTSFIKTVRGSGYCLSLPSEIDI